MHRQNVKVLYKTILRLHRSLPQEMRELGDQYVKDEFKRHKTVSKEHVAPFMMEWANYCNMLAQQIGLRGPKSAKGRIGITLGESQLEHFDDQQIYQLYELRQSINPLDEVGHHKSPEDSSRQTTPTKNRTGRR